MSEVEMLASVLDSRRLARDVLDAKRDGGDVYTRPWWVPEGMLDMAIDEVIGRQPAAMPNSWPFA